MPSTHQSADDAGRGALRQLLGAELPDGLEALDDAQLQALSTLMHNARRQQQARLQQALEAALRHVPGLARGAVRRILFPERR